MEKNDILIYMMLLCIMKRTVKHTNSTVDYHFLPDRFYQTSKNLLFFRFVKTSIYFKQTKLYKFVLYSFLVLTKAFFSFNFNWLI